MKLDERLADFGVPVIPARGWEDNTNGGRDREGTVGIVIHWDALSSWPGVPFYLGMNRFGGILYHCVIDRAGRCRLLSQRYAWHAGKGDPQVLEALEAGGPADEDGSASTRSGNPWLFGVALNFHPNEGSPNDDQRSGLVATLAALCRHFDLNPGQIIDHRRWTPRKPDVRWSKEALDEIRRDVAVLLSDYEGGADDMFVVRTQPNSQSKAWRVEYWKRMLLRIDPELELGPERGDEWGVYSDAMVQAVKRYASPATGLGIGPGEADRIMARVRAAERGESQPVDQIADTVAALSKQSSQLVSTVARITSGLRAASGGDA